jgi:hypothetical protein
VASFVAGSGVLTEAGLCIVCSGYEILRRNGRCGQRDARSELDATAREFDAALTERAEALV